MLAIRMQRTGRKGHSQFRVIVQESRLNPKSGRVVAFLGSYDPHTKATIVDAEKAAYFLEHGAQPSDRVALLLQKEGVKLPKWVNVDTAKKGAIKNTDKLRRNRPAEEAASVAEEAPAAEAEAPAEEVAPESPAVEVEAEVAADTPTEEAEAAEAVGPETPASEA